MQSPIKIAEDSEDAYQFLLEILEKGIPRTSAYLHRTGRCSYLYSSAVSLLSHVILENHNSLKKSFTKRAASALSSYISLGELSDEFTAYLELESRRNRAAFNYALHIYKKYINGQQRKLFDLRDADRESRRDLAVEMLQKILQTNDKPVSLSKISRVTGIPQENVLKLYRDEATRISIQNEDIQSIEPFEFNGISFLEAWKEGEVNEPKIYVVDGFPIVVAVGDIHAPFHNSAALQTLFRKLVELKPDVIVLGGDTFDCICLSAYSKPKKFTFAEPERLQCCGFIRSFVDAVRSINPNIRILFMKGNHENRLHKYIAEKAPALRGSALFSYETYFGMAGLGIEIIPDYVEAVRIGGVHFSHGDKIVGGRGANQAEKSYNRWGHSTIIEFHHHKISSFRGDTIYGTERGGYSVGCLSQLDPKYAPFNTYRHGFMQLEFDYAGSELVDNYEILQRNGSRILRAVI